MTQQPSPYPRTAGQVSMDNMKDPAGVQKFRRRMDVIHTGKNLYVSAKDEALEQGRTESEANDIAQEAYDRWLTECDVDLANGRMARPRTAVQSKIIEQVTIKQHSTMPPIPSQKQAEQAGLVQPARLSEFMLQRLHQSVGGVTIPEIPDSVFKIAYEILPAWIRDYGHKYSAPASTIVRAWINALIDGDPPTFANGVPTGRVIEPWQLPGVVYDLSEAGKPFNASVMHAASLRRLDRDKEATYAYRQEFLKRDHYNYNFFPSLNPSMWSNGLDAEQDWTALAGFPHDFPTDIPVPKEVLKVINLAVQFRFDSEPEFCAICARWLGGCLVQIVQCLIRDKTYRATNKDISDLSYRFPVEAILRSHEHQSDSHSQRSAWEDRSIETREPSAIEGLDAMKMTRPQSGVDEDGTYIGSL